MWAGLVPIPEPDPSHQVPAWWFPTLPLTWRTVSEPAASTLDDVHVWFLRGINVGGAHSVRMAALREHLTELGAAEVRTYIQSGNIAFRAGDALAGDIRRGFEHQASERHGFAIPVMARTASELARLVVGNPFLTGVDPEGPLDHKRYHVGLLQDVPADETLAVLESGQWLPDEYALRGRELYFNLPLGVANSKLLQWKGFSKLWAGLTLRNWRTIVKTLALVRELPPTH